MKNLNTTTYDPPTYPETVRERVAHLETERDEQVKEIKRLRHGVTCVARQRLSTEIPDDEKEEGGPDYEGAYDTMITTARAALKGGERP